MEKRGEIILYQPDSEVRLEVRLENETVWLSIEEMSQLFGRDISVIGKHIRNVFKEGELLKEAVWAKFAYTASDGKTYQVDYYNLDVIISVGYRVKSHRGTQFRQWANKVLKEYLLKGHVINYRLEQMDTRLQKHERQIEYLTDKVDFFVRTSLPPVKADIYTQTVSRQLQLDLQKHSSQYPPISIHVYKKCHDRFLIIDGTDVWHIGASLKDLGKKMFAFSRLDIPAATITALL